MSDTQITPTQLADALGSGDWTRARGRLAIGESGRCCLGVLCSIDPEINFDPNAKVGSPGSLSGSMTSDAVYYGRTGNPNPADGWIDPVRDVLICSNDEGAEDVWENFTIPFLRSLQLDEDGFLSKDGQPEWLDELITGETTWEKVMAEFQEEQ